MDARARARRWSHEAFLENLPLKVVSVAFSLGFYAFLHGAQNAQRAFPVSVVVLLPPDDQGRALLTQPPASVRVTLSGARTILDELKSEDLGNLQLDLRKGNESYVNFDPSRLKIPTGLTPTVEPPGTELSWDNVVAREVPIQLSVTGQPALGFAVQGQPNADPKTVLARGPRTLVETIQQARAEPFDVSGLTEGTFSRKLTLDAPASRVRLLEPSVMVTVQVARARLDRVYVKLPVQVVGAAHPGAVPAEVDVRVSGPPELVDALRRDQIVPVADARAAANEAKTGSASLPVTVTLEGCTAQVIPASVVVRW